MNILDTIGINVIDMAIYFVLFVILLVLVKKFLVKPVTKMLDERQAAVRKIEEDLGKAGLTINESEETAKSNLVTSKKQGDELIEKSKKSAEEQRAELIEEAKAEAAKIVKKAKEYEELTKAQLQKEFDAKVKSEAKKVLVAVLSESGLKLDDDSIDKIMAKVK